ncbi:MAG: hypothetical protein ABSA67_16080 [Candidatus Brocadiia bacterium]|jgi:hypothetical protein
MAEQPGAPEKPVEKTATQQKAAAPEKAAAPSRTPEKAATPAKAEEKAGAPARDEKTEALEKRILELEKRSGGVKWTAALAAAALVCAVIAIVCAVTLSRPPVAPKVIQAEGIQLNDPQGRFRAEIGQIDSGWGLALSDRGAAEAQTGSPAGGASPQIEIRIGNGDNHLIVRGLAPHKSVVDLGVNKLGWPSIILFDKETAARRAVLGETEVPSEGKLEKRAPDSVVLSDKQGAPIWKAGETADDFAPVAPVLPATP